MSRSHDSSNPEPSPQERAPQQCGEPRSRPPGGWHLTRVLLSLVLVFGVLGMQGCHKIFGEFDVESQDPPEDCLTGTHRCVDEFLVACDDGVWGGAQPCTTVDRCDSTAGACRICEPGTPRCNGAWREICSADGTAWEPEEECRDEATCDSLMCLCLPNQAECRPMCPDGEVRCQASEAGNDQAPSNVLAQCQGGETWQVIDTCDTEALCERTVDIAMSDPGSFTGACMDPECTTPGELSCEGNVLRRCAQGQQMWNPIDTCETAEVCNHVVATVTDPNMAATLTDCVAPCSPAGSFRCDGQDVLQCNATQTGEELVATCLDEETCDVETGGCRKCTPGELRCNVASLETCNAAYEWVLVAECATRALCSISTDAVSGAMQGECIDPSCDPGDFACEGATLLQCNTDRTEMVLDKECGSSTLCNETDGRCDEPVCAVDGSLECTADNTLRRCVDGRSRWETVTECPVGTTCSSDPSLSDPCLTECPDPPVQCIGNIRRVCSDETGVAIWTVDQTCNSPELCQCALNGNCAAYTEGNKCGVPVCGENLPDFNCNEGTLQACSEGRDRWVDQTECGSADLCSEGDDGDNGACLACPVAGEVQCYNSNTARRTCSADQSEWTNSQTCGYGCVDDGTEDYCAVCFTDELRCANGDLDVCASDRRTLEDQQNCAYTCVNNGLDDFCAPCQAGESRCNGATVREECSDDLSELVHAEDCAYSCIDDGLDDFCGTCQDGAEQCNGDDLETCTGGVWGGGMQCGNGCISDPDGADFCAPDCNPDEFTPECDGDTLLTCSDDGEFVETICGGSAAQCIVVGSTARCAACDPLDYDNSCDGDELVSCSASGTVTSTACPISMPKCIDVSGEGECAACDPADTTFDECTNSTTLRECSASGEVLTSTCSDPTPVCTEISEVADCRECLPGATQCASSDSQQECGADGTWGTPVDCPSNVECISATGVCAECADGTSECVGNSGNIHYCIDGSWGPTEDCPGGADCTNDECEDPTTNTVTTTVTVTTTNTTSTTDGGTGGATSTTAGGAAGTGGTGGGGSTGGAAGGGSG